MEQRIAQLQLWLAQRQPLLYIRDQAALLWGMTSYCTLKKYLRVARSRMVEELVEDRLVHQAEAIYALQDVARRAAEAEQFCRCSRCPSGAGRDHRHAPRSGQTTDAADATTAPLTPAAAHRGGLAL